MILAGITAVKSEALAETKSISVSSQASIAPVLELSISQEGQQELRFGNIQPLATTATEIGPITILIRVNSNTGERYQITQTLNGVLENSAGDQMSLDHLKFTTAATSTNGVAVASPTSVSTSPQIIFTSDEKGISDTVSARYTLTVPASQAPGDYSTLLTYTISSL